MLPTTIFSFPARFVHLTTAHRSLNEPYSAGAKGELTIAGSWLPERYGRRAINSLQGVRVHSWKWGWHVGIFVLWLCAST